MTGWPGRCPLMYPAQQFEQGKAAFFWLLSYVSGANGHAIDGEHRCHSRFQCCPAGMTHKVRTPQLLGEPEQEAARQRVLQPNARCSGATFRDNKVASDKGEAGRGVSRRKAMSAAPIGHCAPVRHVGQPSSENLQIPRATSKAEPLQGRDGQRTPVGLSQPTARGTADRAGAAVPLARPPRPTPQTAPMPRGGHPCGVSESRTNGREAEIVPRPPMARASATSSEVASKSIKPTRTRPVMKSNDRSDRGAAAMAAILHRATGENLSKTAELPHPLPSG